MGKPLTALTLASGEELKFPQGKNDGAHQLLQIIDRMPQLIPSNLDAGPIISAIAVEANKRDLRGVDAPSVIVAAFNIACLGLPPGAMGYVHMIPFRDSKRGAGKFAQVVVGYKGWRELAYRNGFLKGFEVDAVMDEEFDCWRDSDGIQLFHDLSNPDRHVTWDKIRQTYCFWHANTGGRGIAQVSKSDLMKLKSKQGNVWNSNPVPMALKTAILRARKSWPDTAEIAAAGMLDEYAERGEMQPALPGTAELVEPDKPPVSLTDFTDDKGFRAKIDACNGDRDKLDLVSSDIAACPDFDFDSDEELRSELIKYAVDAKTLTP